MQKEMTVRMPTPSAVSVMTNSLQPAKAEPSPIGSINKRTIGLMRVKAANSSLRLMAIL